MNKTDLHGGGRVGLLGACGLGHLGIGLEWRLARNHCGVLGELGHTGDHSCVVGDHRNGRLRRNCGVVGHLRHKRELRRLGGLGLGDGLLRDGNEGLDGERRLRGSGRRLGSHLGVLGHMLSGGNLGGNVGGRSGLLDGLRDRLLGNVIRHGRGLLGHGDGGDGDLGLRNSGDSLRLGNRGLLGITGDNDGDGLVVDNGDDGGSGVANRNISGDGHGSLDALALLTESDGLDGGEGDSGSGILFLGSDGGHGCS